jgi:hypothetical protein
MSALFFIEESEAASHIPVLSRHLCIHAHQDYSARSHPASMPPVTLVHPWTSSLCLAPTGSASRMSRYGHPWPLTTLVLPCTSSAVQNRSRRFCLTPRGSHASILLKTKTAPNGTVCVLAESEAASHIPVLSRHLRIHALQDSHPKGFSCPVDC